MLFASHRKKQLAHRCSRNTFFVLCSEDCDPMSLLAPTIDRLIVFHTYITSSIISVPSTHSSYHLDVCKILISPIWKWHRYFKILNYFSALLTLCLPSPGPATCFLFLFSIFKSFGVKPSTVAAKGNEARRATQSQYHLEHL